MKYLFLYNVKLCEILNFNTSRIISPLKTVLLLFSFIIILSFAIDNWKALIVIFYFRLSLSAEESLSWIEDSLL